ncbi:ATP--guanido phosphotransferase [Peptoniphilus sp. AGMB00490]|uniref:ATP--guanido phosphotransferase n=1 Tax=Peptoniphilus faecalis TaxID=2731255 RepID=A0A848R936_9FIRM|nr:ATP--guanido phosphotransferase [Peptoniphilus faecalis]
MSVSKIILGYKLKLYRNIDGKKFVNAMTEEELRKNLEFVYPILTDLGYTKVDMEKISSLKKLEYVENGRIGKNFLEKSNIGFYEKKDAPDILINAGEHIELSIFSRVKTLSDLFKEIYDLEEKLEDKINFAFDPNFGYLSSRVLNAGTGLKPIAILYLPALNYFGINEIARGLSRLGYTLGSYRDSSNKALGSIYTLSFESTFGEDEKSYIDKLKIIVREIADVERENRKKLYLDNIITLEDMVNRSFGVLANARVLSEEEMMQSMSTINLGIELSILKPNREFDFYEEIIKLRNGHLQIERGAILDLKSRDILRANKARALMKEVFK